ncbi:indole-3-glycerol phosphate synthase TrpC [Aestuariispira insulae]|uniref:Indole-3-glycerol phosphate synthase n=1 Tax=Aestuariispira insulae TaxID=1461337 RepID=A0A3D9HV18_9PROT|nr:indole-3-glycerol phosphate synthase TrpC [Aestuariispira insulae]RED53280.1 indole-3-glycerol phosphate synthase [Aestuariispira insulae]
MSDVLEKICNDKRAHIEACKAEISPDEMIEKARKGPRTRSFYDTLRGRAEDGQFGLIAEIKKASPSKGLIREDFAPAALARAYRAGGAACLSILTDTPYFQGSNDYLIAARMVVDLPVLRKDFMLDPYQVYEARAIGADCILLIMAALDDDDADELESLAFELGMDVLIEVHNQEELDRALELRSPMIGVNNRNLKTLEIDLATTEELAAQIPDDKLLVAESGLYSHEDLVRMSKVGATTFLVGESLMRQTDVTAATKALLGLDAA